MDECAGVCLGLRHLDFWVMLQILWPSFPMQKTSASMSLALKGGLEALWVSMCPIERFDLYAAQS